MGKTNQERSTANHTTKNHNESYFWSFELDGLCHRSCICPNELNTEGMNMNNNSIEAERNNLDQLTEDYGQYGELVKDEHDRQLVGGDVNYSGFVPNSCANIVRLNMLTSNYLRKQTDLDSLEIETNEKMDEIVNILTDNGRKEKIDLKSLLNYLIKIHQPVLNESLEHGLDQIPQTMVSQDDLRKFIHQMYHFHAIFGLRHAHGIPEIIYQKEKLADCNP